jgi:hypothetical protein
MAEDTDKRSAYNHGRIQPCSNPAAADVHFMSADHVPLLMPLLLFMLMSFEQRALDRQAAAHLDEELHAVPVPVAGVHACRQRDDGLLPPAVLPTGLAPAGAVIHGSNLPG